VILRGVQRSVVAAVSAALIPTARRRYRVDLAADQATCAANYARLQRLLPADVDSTAFGVGAGVELHLLLVERSRYTDTLVLRQLGLGLAALAPALTVRLYHDARLAEVTGFANRRRVLPRYDYPNPAMHQPDEKAQWNRFLGEWLSHCLQHGHSLGEPLLQF
jgi:uncharacterized protein YqiB (DUF1249 family)